ncbi:hypothetical protein GQ457_15G029320 [Hibiscus cannabinus]
MGLLEPLDPDLRRYIIHYGQMVGAVGDLFNSLTRGPNASVEDFFSHACLVRGNSYEYKVSRFIYAGSEGVDSAWIGYVAVTTDQGECALGRRDILVAWRGTATPSEWRNNTRVLPRATASDLFPGMTQVKVHRGFHSLYTGTRPGSPHNRSSARKQFLAAVEELVKSSKVEEISITVTGFSLGAALATLTAMDMVTHGYNKTPKGKPFMVTAFTFGGPRVGNHGLAREVHTLGLGTLRLLRIRNRNDFIPNIPPSLLRKKRDRTLGCKKINKEDLQDSELSGRSLSDTDLRGKWEQAKKEARRTLELGKKFGLKIKGSEEEAISSGKMKCVSWNARGMGSNGKMMITSGMVKSQKVEVLLLQETKKTEWSAEEIRKIWSDDDFEFRMVEADGRSGRWIRLDVQVKIVNVYAPCSVAEQAKLWEELYALKVNDSTHWLMGGGDFNATRNRSESSKCSNLIAKREKFNNFIMQGHFIDLPLRGKKFTWFGPGNKRSRLDRFLIDEFWILNLRDLVQLGLKRNISDHIPILLTTKDVDWGPIPFKFFSGWLYKDGGKEVIKEAFGEVGAEGDLVSKLRCVKMALKRWNKNSCVNIDAKVKELEEKLDRIDEGRNRLQGTSSDSMDEEAKKIKSELWDYLRIQEDLWRQKARVNWLSLGDANTKFFHKTVKIRSRRKLISRVKVGGVWTEKPKELKAAIFKTRTLKFSDDSKFHFLIAPFNLYSLLPISDLLQSILPK